MSTQSSRNKRTIGNGKNPLQGIQHKKGLLEHGLSGRVGGQSSFSNSGGVASACFLNKELTPKSHFINYDQDKLVKVLPSIYECLKQSPAFKDDKDWKTLPSLIELADYLIKSIAEVVPAGYKWMVKGEDFNNDDLKIFYAKDTSVSDDYLGLPLEWLPQIKEKNYSLYSLICNVISFIYERCEVELIFTQYDDYFIEDGGCRESGDENEDMLNDIDAARYRKDGEVYNWRKDILEYKGVYSDKFLIEQINSLKPKGKLEAAIKKWLKIGISVLLDPPSLSDYILQTEEDYSDGEGLKLSDSLHFVWSFYDQVFINGEQFRNDVYSNTGYIETVEFGVLTQEKHIEPIPSDKLKNLELFFKQGRTLYYTFFETKLIKQYDKRREHYGI